MGFLLAALLGGFLVFNTQATPRKVEGMAETALRQRFPRAQVRVTVRGKSGRSVLRGKFDVVHVEMADFELAGTSPAAPANSSPSAESVAAESVMPGSAPANSTPPDLVAVPNAKRQGHIGRVELQLRDFNYDGLKVERAEIEFNDVVYDLDVLKNRSQVRLVAVGLSKARLCLPAASLQGMVHTRLRDITDARLTVRDGSVLVTGKKPAPLFGTPVPIAVTAKLEARQGTEIWLADSHVTVGGLPVPALLAKSLTADLNPVYVFDRERKWPLRVQVTSIQTHDNRVDVSGDLIFVPATVKRIGTD
jgi:LmeA-like phospholipid-binding